MTEPEIRYATPARPRLDLLDPAHLEHVWIAAAIYRLSPDRLRDSELNLDRENLATVEVGCWVCEQPYEDRLSYRKCPGEPTP